MAEKHDMASPSGPASKRLRQIENPFEEGFSEEEEAEAEERNKDLLFGEGIADVPPDDNESEEEQKEADSSEDRELLLCFIHGDRLEYPAVNCCACDNCPMCNECLKKWNMQKNGGTETVPCPKCKAKSGFKEIRWVNSVIGQRKVACQNSVRGCGEMVTLEGLDIHLTKYCRFSRVKCGHSKHGCPWFDVRSKLAAHEAACDFEKRAAALQQLEKKKQELTQFVVALEKRAEASIRNVTVLTRTITDAIEAETKCLRLQQTCVQLGGITSFFKLRTPDIATAALKSPFSLDVGMRLQITLDSHKFFSVSAFFDDSNIRYPIFAAGWLLLHDAGVSGSEACRPFSLKLKQPNEHQCIFTETDVYPTSTPEQLTEALAQRNPHIKFAITGAVLWPNDLK